MSKVNEPPVKTRPCSLLLVLLSR